MNAPHTTDVEFSQLGLDVRLLESLNEHGLTHCTSIQAECLPIALAGKDVAGQAQTGTGKTAAFLLAIMQHLLNKPERPGRKQQQPRTIIISPTRELAIQIHKDAVMLNAHAGLSLGLVYGGVDYEKQRNSLNEKIDILIGTPGRLIDYHKQNVYSLKGIEIVVLDEADRMFDLGFIADIRYMFRRMPPPENRLNMLFSATLSHRVTELAYEHMNSPEKILINPDQVTAENVKQTMYHVANDEKISLLLGLMEKIDPKRSIVFVNTKRAAEKVWSYLEGNGYHSAVLSGDVPQNKRQRLFKEFSEGRLPVLVATDLAARGLHVPEVSHVFNYDLPQNAEDYVHRIGRTARAGASGDAVSFACEEFVYSLMEIEEYIGHKLPASEIVTDMLVEPKPPVKVERKRSGGSGRGRHSGGGRNRSNNRSSSRRR
jgi:ATP-dependent RNA helicase RhlB